MAEALVPLTDASGEASGHMLIQSCEPLASRKGYRVLDGSSRLGKAVTEALKQHPEIVDASLVRIVSNSGQSVSLSALAKASSGVGSRGFVAKSGRISENVRLVKPSSVGNAAKVIAPGLLLAGATVALDMVAQQQQTALLNEIRDLVKVLRDDQLRDYEHALQAAGETLEDAAARVLDHADFGAELGLDSAVHEVKKAYQRAKSLVGDLEAGRAALDANKRSKLGQMEKQFPGIDSVGGQFWRDVQYVRTACVLQGRALALQVMASDSRNGDQDLHRSAALLQRRMDDLVELENRLGDFLAWLADRKLRLNE